MEEAKRRKSDNHRWIVISTIGLSLCIAGTEYERYTALWVFETRSAVELISIIIFFAAVIGVIIRCVQKNKGTLYRKKWLLIALSVVQTFGLAGRCVQASGGSLGEPLAVAVSVSMHSASILFIIYAEFFLDIGERKAISVFALALAGAGLLQIAVLGFDWPLAIFFLFLFVPCSAVLLALSDNLYSSVDHDAEREDILAEVRDGERFVRSSPFWEYCISISLLEVLLIALHSTVMVTQDSGSASFVIQVTSGFGTLISGVIFYALLRYLQETEFIELLRILVLPLILIALYISALFGASGVPLYLTPLAVAYSILLLFVWTVPRNYRKVGTPFIFTCIAYFSYRVGWALGVYGIMILPQHYGNLFETSVVLIAFVVLFVLSAVRLLKFRRNDIKRLNRGGDVIELRASTDIAFSEACSQVSRNFQLTPREAEVLVLLARGRNARHIAESLVISDGTARTHIMHIYQKMRVNSQQVLMDIVDDELKLVMEERNVL